MLAQHMIYWQMVGSISLRWPDNVPIRLALCRRCFIIGPILGRHHQRTPHRYHVGPVIVIRSPYSGAISDEVMGKIGTMLARYMKLLLAQCWPMLITHTFQYWCHVGPVIAIRWPYSGALSDEVMGKIGTMLAH